MWKELVTSTRQGGLQVNGMRGGHALDHLTNQKHGPYCHCILAWPRRVVLHNSTEPAPRPIGSSETTTTTLYVQLRHCMAGRCACTCTLAQCAVPCMHAQQHQLGRQYQLMGFCTGSTHADLQPHIQTGLPPRSAPDYQQRHAHAQWLAQTTANRSASRCTDGCTHQPHASFRAGSKVDYHVPNWLASPAAPTAPMRGSSCSAFQQQTCLLNSKPAAAMLDLLQRQTLLQL
jgi:hypothetical protein